MDADPDLRRCTSCPNETRPSIVAAISFGGFRLRTLYADNDPYCAAWLRALAAEDNIPDGDILCADIQEMHGNDLKKYDQVHLFAGIGGWPYALRLAGWPDGRPVWTGSCPCQPFSGAGKRRGRADERHLWPDFFRLIAKCRPPTIFGEQVAGPLGRAWLSGGRASLEHLGYAVGAADLPAACVGAPHIRQRLFWVANATGKRFGKTGKISSGPKERASDGGSIGGLGDSTSTRRARPRSGGSIETSWNETRLLEPSGSGASVFSQLGDSDSTRHEIGARITGDDDAAVGEAPGQAVEQAGPWNPFDLIPCADGKMRRIESSTFPLAYGISNRVGRLRAYGNAIVPQAAATFVRAAMSIDKTAEARV